MVTVINITFAKTWAFAVSIPKPNWRNIDTTTEAVIAEISDQALILHQNQRRIYTEPVPAPRANSNFHAPAMLSIWEVTTAPANTIPTVVQRAAFT